MSKIAISGAATGTATFTIESPATSTNRTLTLPDNTGTIITQNSTPAFASTIGVGGATAAASGAGITFPATQSASSDANTLDDYEEGTYTATLTCGTSGTITLSQNTLAYTKIGRLVTISGYLSVTSVASPVGSINLNLPISISGSLPAQTGGLFLGNALASGNVLNYWMYTDTGTNKVSIFLGGGTSVSTAAAQTVQANSEFRVFLTYIAA